MPRKVRRSSASNTAEHADGGFSIVPRGETVDERLRSLMEHPLYSDPVDGRLRDHVSELYRHAYPGEARADATGRTEIADPAIRPEDVTPFDPSGSGGNGGTVHVRQHTRDGHHVSAYDRTAPGGGGNQARGRIHDGLSAVGGGGYKGHEPDRPKSPIPEPKYRDDKKGGAFFGDRRRNPDGSIRKHQGVDIVAKAGAPVTSPVWGRIEIRDSYSSGHPLAGKFTNIRVIGDDGRSYDLYYVAAKDANGNPLVRNGDRVAPGTAIGTVQDRASKDPGMQNHIHFEVEENGKKIDPKPVIDRWIGGR